MAKLNITYTDIIYQLPYVPAEIVAGETKDVNSATTDTTFVTPAPAGESSLLTLAPEEDMFVSIAPVPDASQDAKRRLVFGGQTPTFLVPAGWLVSARLVA